MKIKNLLILLLAVAGLGYAGIKGYVYFKVKRQVDRLALTAAPFANIQYGSIGSTLDGVILISDIVVRPRGIDDTVNIEQLRVVTPGLEFLLNGAESMGQGKFPERFGVQLQGVGLKLDGGLVKMWEKMEAEQTGRQPSAEHTCTLSRDFISAQYRTLGLNELVFDNDVLIEHVAQSSEIRLSTHYVLRGIEQGGFSVTFTGVGDSVQSVAMATPLLKEAEAGYKPDPALVTRTFEYCAQRQGIDAASFVDGLFDKDDAYYNETLGFIPGPGIRKAIKQMIQDGSELRIAAEPLSPLDLQTVHLYKPEDWPDLFGLSVSVGNTPITDLSLRVPGYTADKREEPLPLFNLPALLQKDGETPENEAAAAKQQEKPKSTRPSYRVVDKKQIPGLLWKDVRIVTVEGKRRSGVIIEVKDGLVSLENRMAGGSMSTRVSIASIKQIEVLE